MLLGSLSGQAALFHGLSIKADTFTEKEGVRPSVIIELCKGKPESVLACKGHVEVIECKREPENSGNTFQWDCMTEENYPYRLGLKIGKTIFYSAPSYYLATDRTRDKYALHLEGGHLDAVKLPFSLSLQIGMQEMLENVFHPSIVQKIREKDQSKTNHFWSPVEKPETKMVLTSCQFQDCSKGKSKDTSCTFSTRGIRALSYTCEVPSFTRYMRFTLYGKDKIRKTELFRFEDRKEGGYGLNHISVKSDKLEVRYDVPSSI